MQDRCSTGVPCSMDGLIGGFSSDRIDSGPIRSVNPGGSGNTAVRERVVYDSTGQVTSVPDITLNFGSLNTGDLLPDNHAVEDSWTVQVNRKSKKRVAAVVQSQYELGDHGRQGGVVSTCRGQVSCPDFHG